MLCVRATLPVQGFAYSPETLQLGVDALGRPSGEAWLSFESSDEALRRCVVGSAWAWQVGAEGACDLMQGWGSSMVLHGGWPSAPPPLSHSCVNYDGPLVLTALI